MISRLIRQLRSGVIVSYDGLPFLEALALAHALNEWEYIQHHIMLEKEKQEFIYEPNQKLLNMDPGPYKGFLR